MEINFLLEDASTEDLLVDLCREASRRKYYFKFLNEIESDSLVIAYSQKPFTIKQALKAYDNA